MYAMSPAKGVGAIPLPKTNIIDKEKLLPKNPKKMPKKLSKLMSKSNNQKPPLKRKKVVPQ